MKLATKCSGYFVEKKILASGEVRQQIVSELQLECPDDWVDFPAQCISAHCMVTPLVIDVLERSPFKLRRVHQALSDARFPKATIRPVEFLKPAVLSCAFSIGSCRDPNMIQPLKKSIYDIRK